MHRALLTYWCAFWTYRSRLCCASFQNFWHFHSKSVPHLGASACSVEEPEHGGKLYMWMELWNNEHTDYANADKGPLIVPSYFIWTNWTGASTDSGSEWTFEGLAGSFASSPLQGAVCNCPALRAGFCMVWSKQSPNHAVPQHFDWK